MCFQDEELVPEQVPPVDTMFRSSQLLASLITDVLHFSRVHDEK